MHTEYTIGFPRTADAEPYKDLSFDEAQERVLDEIKQSVGDMGSEGYNLAWPDNIPDYLDHPEEWTAWFDALSDEDAEHETMQAHERGIEQAAKAQFNEIWEALIVYGEAMLPDKTLMSMTMTTNRGEH